MTTPAADIGLSRRPRRYQHVISLGGFCSVAQELQRYGLRDASYPLDWVISPIQPALKLIESGFSDALRPGAIERDAKHAYIAHDRVAGIDYYHDFDPDRAIEDQLDAVRAKYERRARRLKDAMAERTLFVRYIMDSEEYAYLDENMADVLGLLRHSHPLSDLLLIGDADTPSLCGGLTVHRVAVDEGDTVAREFARNNRALHLTLLGLNYPLRRRLANYRRYRQAIPKNGRFSSGVKSLRCAIMSTVRAVAVGLLGEDRAVTCIARIRSLKAKA